MGLAPLHSGDTQSSEGKGVMDMLVKTLKRAGIGFLLGMAVGNLISAVCGGSGLVSQQLVEQTGSFTAAVILQTVFSGLIGAASFGAMSLYDIERWPMLVTTIVHWAIYMPVFAVSGWVLHWFPSLIEWLIMAAIMTVCHALIYLIMCARYRSEVRELNKLQSNLQKENKEDGGAE